MYPILKAVASPKAINIDPMYAKYPKSVRHYLTSFFVPRLKPVIAQEMKNRSNKVKNQTSRVLFVPKYYIFYFFITRVYYS